jgi:hypothetical protein
MDKAEGKTLVQVFGLALGFIGVGMCAQGLIRLGVRSYDEEVKAVCAENSSFCPEDVARARAVDGKILASGFAAIAVGVAAMNKRAAPASNA